MQSQKIASEYEIKSMWIGKFCQFTEWPEISDINDLNKPFRIVVFGKNPFGNLMNDVYNNKKIKQKQVNIIFIDEVKKLPECEVIFIASTSSIHLKEILQFYESKPVLTLSDSPGFGEKGVKINIYKEGNLIKFEINEKKVIESTLKMSHLLLKQAKIIGTTEVK